MFQDHNNKRTFAFFTILVLTIVLVYNSTALFEQNPLTYGYIHQPETYQVWSQSEDKRSKHEEKYLNDENESVRERFSTRLKRYNTICKREAYQTIKQTRYVSSYRSQFANYRLNWCQIPKVASTFLKKVRRINVQNLKQQGVTKYPAQHRKKFFLVREPYSRLVSGYLSKFVASPRFWRQYGKDILSKHRLKPSNDSMKCGHDVTFPEFIKYVIRSQETGLLKNKHFMPIHELCSMCKEDYDYIVHLETLNPDMSYIFRSVNVSIDMDVKNTVEDIRNKVRSVIDGIRNHKVCSIYCSTFRRLWWAFQAWGYVSSDSKFPLTEKECESASSATKFTDLVVGATKQFTDREKRSKQKKFITASLYRQVPLEDRKKIQNILSKDFELFDYDPQPDNVFPELLKYS